VEVVEARGLRHKLQVLEQLVGLQVGPPGASAAPPTLAMRAQPLSEAPVGSCDPVSQCAAGELTVGAQVRSRRRFLAPIFYVLNRCRARLRPLWGIRGW
jgi:hypothetical protein